MTSDYTEFQLLSENAREYNLPFTAPPIVRRTVVDVGPGQQVSTLAWGAGDPELVLLHGGAQNAHTWDTVALALNRPLMAVDLPGHGHSSWRADQDYSPNSNAEAVSTVIRRLAGDAPVLIGVCLGGLTAIRIASRHPDLVSALVIIDITPGVSSYGPATTFVQGPSTFDSFDELLDHAIRHHPSRSVRSLRRGLLHNTRRLPDGRWTWRYDQAPLSTRVPNHSTLWNDLSDISQPVMLVRGSLSHTVKDEDIMEFRTHIPGVRVEVINGAGHSVQGDRPIELAGLIEEFMSAVRPRKLASNGS